MLDEAASPDPAARDALESVLAQVDRLEEELDRASDGTSFFGMMSVTGPPTADQLRDLEDSRTLLPGVVERINALVTERVPALYRQLYQEGMAPDPGGPIPLPVPPGR